jgi:hypothetical protein
MTEPSTQATQWLVKVIDAEHPRDGNPIAIPEGWEPFATDLAGSQPVIVLRQQIG